MPGEIQAKAVQDGDIFFDFKCDCGAEGELVISSLDGYKSFGCPEGCGNTYVPYRAGALRTWRLRCVVKAVYAKATGGAA